MKDRVDLIFCSQTLKKILYWKRKLTFETFETDVTYLRNDQIKLERKKIYRVRGLILSTLRH